MRVIFGLKYVVGTKVPLPYRSKKPSAGPNPYEGAATATRLKKQRTCISNSKRMLIPSMTHSSRNRSTFDASFTTAAFLICVWCESRSRRLLNNLHGIRTCISAQVAEKTPIGPSTENQDTPSPCPKKRLAQSAQFRSADFSAVGTCLLYSDGAIQTDLCKPSPPTH